jgi:hypothetical protein
LVADGLADRVGGNVPLPDFVGIDAGFLTRR